MECRPSPPQKKQRKLESASDDGEFLGGGEGNTRGRANMQDHLNDLPLLLLILLVSKQATEAGGGGMDEEKKKQGKEESEN